MIRLDKSSQYAEKAATTRLCRPMILAMETKAGLLNVLKPNRKKHVRRGMKTLSHVAMNEFLPLDSLLLTVKLLSKNPIFGKVN